MPVTDSDELLEAVMVSELEKDFDCVASCVANVFDMVRVRGAMAVFVLGALLVSVMFWDHVTLLVISFDKDRGEPETELELDISAVSIV